MLLRFIAENIYSFKGAAEFILSRPAKVIAMNSIKYPVLTQRPSGLVQSTAPMVPVRVTSYRPSNF